ncbi:MAG: hypothetical protein H6613_02115 [Ignavibacteriales bacterium]|nr:hypothetical protein [Ignavibacteriales bacterium]
MLLYIFNCFKSNLSSENGKLFLLIAVNIILIIAVFFLANKAEKSNNVFLKSFHFYYVFPLIFLSFKQVYILLRSIHSHDYDPLLIELDRFIFGGDPTVFLYQFANPILTEIAQIAYGTFFFLPIILGIEFQRKNKTTELSYIIFIVVFGFFFPMPAIFYFLLLAQDFLCTILIQQI